MRAVLQKGNGAALLHKAITRVAGVWGSVLSTLRNRNEEAAGAAYRVIRLDPNGLPIAFDMVVANSEAEAIRQFRDQLNGESAELWRGARLVDTYFR
jgi:hypothetical protein